MNSVSSKSNVAISFLSGFVSAVALYYLTTKTGQRQRLSKSEDEDEKLNSIVKKRFQGGPTEYTTTPSDLEADAPDLELRLIRKAETVILKRTSRIIVVIERCTDDHNYSAILRTAEAMGIQHLWMVDPPSSNSVDNERENTATKKTQIKHQRVMTQADITARSEHLMFARKAAQWLTIREFSTTKDCIDALREDGREIWATDLGQVAQCLTYEGLGGSFDARGQPTMDDVIPPRLAIVFGTESVGCTQEMLTSADKRVYLPLYGYADSLNLSVATAMVLQQLFLLAPESVGDMSEEERKLLRKKWYSKMAQQRIMTSGEKKIRSRLHTKVIICQEIIDKKNRGEALQDEQLKKIDDFQSLKHELDDLDASVMRRAEASVQDLVNNPPLPLKDMRRADEHRVCFVGRNTRKKNEENWQGMAAISNFGGGAQKGSAANKFRDMAIKNLNKDKDSS